MKEISRILEVYEGIDFTQRKAALATVVWVEGSSYRRPGARMLITDDGRWEGAISGGCLEGDALRKARQVMLDGTPMLVTYDTRDDEENPNGLGVGLGCNGVIDVLIEPIDSSKKDHPIAFLKAVVQRQDTTVLATLVKSESPEFKAGQRFLMTEAQDHKTMPDWLQEDMQSVFSVGKPLTKAYDRPTGTVTVYTERIDPGIELVIFGAGYDTIPVIKFAQELGWNVTVSEDCVAHLAPKRFPVATCLLYADRHNVLNNVPINERTAVVLMSHNYYYDLAVLESILPTKAPYIGMLGPRTRFEKMQSEFDRKGLSFPQADYDRVHAPIGLDIGAETPEEIAISIIGEVKSFFANRRGGSLKDKLGPIHEREPVFA